MLETVTYDATDFSLSPEGDDIAGLKIQLGVDHIFETILPARVVGPDSGPKDTIFYLDVSSSAEILRAAAETLSEHIIADPNITTVITPQSHKSIACMAEAVKIANEKSGRAIECIVLLGGTKESSVSEGDPRYNVHYTPITTPEGKWAGITTDDANLLMKTSSSPNQVMVIDDVYSRGGTFEGVFTLLNSIYTLESSHTFSSAVVAIEQPINALDPDAIPSFLHASRIIPEIPGQG